MKEVYGLGTSYTYYQLQDHGYVMPSRIVPRTGDDPPTTKQLKLTISNITVQKDGISVIQKASK